RSHPMRPLAFLSGFALLLSAACTAPAGAPSRLAAAVVFRYVDLTHDLSSDSIFWPTGATFQLTKVADGVTDKGYYYASNSFSGNEHGGTHLDAPVHFAQGHWRVEQIPLDRLIGSAGVRVGAPAATCPRPAPRTPITRCPLPTSTNGKRSTVRSSPTASS